MAPLKTNLLIAEDDPSVLTSLEQVFTVLGYRVRTAPDGLKAVIALREQVPDILLTDLNMPGMSGFELLSMVRRRFPQIRTIAMSGAFSGSVVPEGVAADAYYQKGCSVGALVTAIEAPQIRSLTDRISPETIWIPGGQMQGYEKGHIMVACPECFRVFPQAIHGSASMILDTNCIYCNGSILFAIVPTLDAVFGSRFTPAPIVLTN